MFAHAINRRWAAAKGQIWSRKFWACRDEKNEGLSQLRRKREYNTAAICLIALDEADHPFFTLPPKGRIVADRPFIFALANKPAIDLTDINHQNWRSVDRPSLADRRPPQSGWSQWSSAVNGRRSVVRRQGNLGQVKRVCPDLRLHACISDQAQYWIDGGCIPTRNVINYR